MLENTSKLGQGIQDAGILRGPAGRLELGVLHAFAGGCFFDHGLERCSAADGLGKVGSARGVIVYGIENAGQPSASDVLKGAGRIIAVDEIDESVRSAERQWLTGAGGFDEAGAAWPVDAAESDGGPAGIGGELFRGEQNVAGRCASRGRIFVHLAGIVLRIDRSAAGEDGELRGKQIDEIPQRFEVNYAVGIRIASVFAAQAMNEQVGPAATGELGV